MSSEEVPDGALRSALELAVGVAAAASSVKPALSFPVALKPFLRYQRLPSAALAEVRAAIEADEAFRLRLASIATEDLVDEAGRVWLARPEGWRERLVAVAEDEPDDEQGPGAVRRAERRRAAAERAAFKSKAEIAALRDEVARDAVTRRDVAATVAQLRRELADLRSELAAAREQVADANARAEAASVARAGASAARDAAVESARDAESVRDRALVERAGRVAPDAMAVAPMSPATVSAARALERAAAACADLARSIGEAAEALASAPTPGVRAGGVGASRRRPIAIPGGTFGDSRAATEHLLRTTNVVAVLDGYNVAKLGWPDLALATQRERCIVAAEQLARRWGTETVIVFDGADVPGASTTARRLVRVRFSPPGVSADDVIRAEVAGFADDVPLVVVTNDQQIVQDVRARGANVVSSDQWLAVALR